MRSFLELLFETKTEDSFLLIWTKSKSDKKVSKWFEEPAEATRYAEKQGESQDVYFGIGLSPTAKGPSKRVESNEVIGIPGLWIDLDIAHGVHKKGKLPPTLEDALNLVYKMPTWPTMIVHTGHGLQAYWLFNLVAIIETGEERLFYSELVERWQRLLKAYAAEDGWDIDSTFDLARVFRVPETLNHKEKETVPVQIIKKWYKHRYEPQHLLTLLESVEDNLGAEFESGVSKQADRKKAVDNVAPITLNPDADIHKLKFDTLCAIEPLFKQSWERKRSAKSLTDQTGSGYDLSLATFAAQAGWSDQEIADLLLASRKKHNDDLKLKNLQYYVRTIAAARVTAGKQEKLHTATYKPVSESHNENLTDISDMLGIKILDLVKFQSEPPQYIAYVELEDTEHGSMFTKQIEIPDDAFLNQSVMWKLFFNYAEHSIPKFKAPAWSALIDKMNASFRRVKMGSESTHLDVFAHWLYKYLKAQYRDDIENESQMSRALRDRPAKIAHEICITLDAFTRYISTEFNERPKREVLQQRLKRLGCESKKKSIYKEDDGKTTSKYMWTVPSDFMQNHENRMEEELVSVVDETRSPIEGLRDDDPVH